MRRFVGIATLTSGFCVAATLLATEERQASSPQGWAEVTRWRGVYECRRTYDKDYHIPYYDTTGHSEEVGSVKFEITQMTRGCSPPQMRLTLMPAIKPSARPVRMRVWRAMRLGW